MTNNIYQQKVFDTLELVESRRLHSIELLGTPLATDCSGKIINIRALSNPEKLIMLGVEPAHTILISVRLTHQPMYI